MIIVWLNGRNFNGGEPSAGDVEQPDGRAHHFIPLVYSFWRGQQLHGAAFLLEEGGCFLGEFYHAGLTRPDDDLLCSLFVDVFRFR